MSEPRKFLFLSLSGLEMKYRACRDHRGRFAACGGGGARSQDVAHIRGRGGQPTKPGQYDRETRPTTVAPADAMAPGTFVTGKPVTVTLHRGTGDDPTRARRDRIPSQYAVGEYLSPHPEVAATYGPDVESRTVTLRNPYVMRLGDRPYYEHLRQEFGTHDVEKITHDLMGRGHDALVVRNIPVHRRRRDTGEPVAMRDSTEVVLLRRPKPR